jgi:hypothetical protein
MNALGFGGFRIPFAFAKTAPLKERRRLIFGSSLPG